MIFYAVRILHFKGVCSDFRTIWGVYTFLVLNAQEHPLKWTLFVKK